MHLESRSTRGQASRQVAISTSTRRGFLKWGLAGLGGAPLLNRLASSAWSAPATSSPRANNVIVLFLTGGPATMDLWDLKPDAPDVVRGEFRPIETSVPGVQICDQMPRLARQMHRVTLVRSVAHTIAEHTQGQAYMLTGNRPRPDVEAPALGALSSALHPPRRGTPPYVQLGAVPYGTPGELGGAFQPLELAFSDASSEPVTREALGLPKGMSVDELARRRRLLEQVDARFAARSDAPVARQFAQLQEDALELLRTDKIRTVLDLERESEMCRANYGNSIVGRGCLLARRLIEAGTRFVTVGFGDWDTHDNHFSRMRTSLVPPLDAALAALVSDLAERGLLDETIIYCAGEFARTPRINPNAGRDHWSQAMTVFLAGGGIRGGRVWGATDEHASAPIENRCTPDDICATIFHQLGFEPQRRIQAATGRDLPLFRDGTVLHEIV